MEHFGDKKAGVRMTNHFHLSICFHHPIHQLIQISEASETFIAQRTTHTDLLLFAFQIGVTK